MISFIALAGWFKALGVVAAPFIKMSLLWVAWQLGLGGLAWGTARFYSNNCAPPGVSGFLSSLFSMGSPICLSAWVGHGVFAVCYLTAFIAAVLFVVVWVWNKTTEDKHVRQLLSKISALEQHIQTPTKERSQKNSTKKKSPAKKKKKICGGLVRVAGRGGGAPEHH